MALAISSSWSASCLIADLPLVLRAGRVAAQSHEARRLQRCVGHLVSWLWLRGFMAGADAASALVAAPATLEKLALD